jgi:hypothetical protein
MFWFYLVFLVLSIRKRKEKEKKTREEKRREQMKLVFSSEKVETEFRNTPRKICIAAHTMPFIDILCLFWAFRKRREEFRIYTVPCPFFLSIFTPSWCKEIKRNGFVQQEVKSLNTFPEFCRILFPSGGTINWKTGFTIIARETGATIVVLGIDYSKGIIVVDSLLSLSSNTSFQEIKEFAIQRLRTYPAHYECMFFLQSLGIPYGDETFPISSRSIWIARFVCFLSVCVFTLSLI